MMERTTTVPDPKTLSRLHAARLLALIVAAVLLVVSQFAWWGFGLFVGVYVIGMLVERSLDELDPARTKTQAGEG